MATAAGQGAENATSNQITRLRETQGVDVRAQPRLLALTGDLCSLGLVIRLSDLQFCCILGGQGSRGCVVVITHLSVCL